MCVFLCTLYSNDVIFVNAIEYFFFINIFFGAFFFGLYIMGGVVRWMIWKGSYKFSFIFFKNNFVAFVSAFLLMVKFVLKFDF